MLKDLEKLSLGDRRVELADVEAGTGLAGLLGGAGARWRQAQAQRPRAEQPPPRGEEAACCAGWAAAGRGKWLR